MCDYERFRHKSFCFGLSEDVLVHIFSHQLIHDLPILVIHKRKTGLWIEEPTIRNYNQKLSVNRRGQSSETFSTLVFFFNWRKFFLYFLTSNACCAEYQNIESNVRTRLSYNCAHLRWTKETLTIEYFRIILEKKFGWKFFGVKIFGVKIFWAKICFGWNFWVKIFWVKTFFCENFWGETFFE